MATHTLPLVYGTNNSNLGDSLVFRSYIRCDASVSVLSSSLANNTTTLSWAFRLVRFDGSWTGTSDDRNTYLDVYIDGTRVHRNTGPISVGYNKSFKIGNGTRVITHDVDGSKKNLELRVIGTAKNSSGGNFSGCVATWTVDLTQLKRADTITVSPTSTLEVEDSLAVSITRLPGTNYSHRVYYKTSSGTNVNLVSPADSGLSWTFTLPASLASYTTISTKFDLIIYCQSYSGSTVLGTTSATTSCTIPSTDSFRPVLSSLVHTDLTTYASTYGQYLQSLSRLRFNCTLSYKFNATLRNIRLSFDNQSALTSSTSTVEMPSPVQGSGNVPVSIVITDSRGISATYTDTVSVLAYAPPIVTTAQALRKTQGGVVDSNGTYVGVDYTFLWTPVGNKNKITYTLQYRDLRTSTFSNFDATNSSGSEVLLSTPHRTYSTSVANLSNALSTTQSYEFRLYVRDTISGDLGYYYPFYLYSVSRLMHFGKDGESLGIGAQGEFTHTLNVGYSLRNPGGIRPVLPPTGSNINDIKTPTTYVFSTSDMSGTLPTNVSGNCSLEVIPVGATETTNHVYQRLRCESSQNKIYERLYNGSTWTDWYTIGEYTPGLTASEIINLIYPVGSIYLSYGSQDPNTFLPGTTWSLIEEGRFLRSASKTGSIILGGKGGSTSKSLYITVPSHKHIDSSGYNTGNKLGGMTFIEGENTSTFSSPFFGYPSVGVTGTGSYTWRRGKTSTPTDSQSTFVTVDTVPPYLAVYMWERIS